MVLYRYLRINSPLFSTVLPSNNCYFCPVGLSLLIQHFQQVLWVLKLLLSPGLGQTWSILWYVGTGVHAFSHFWILKCLRRRLLYSTVPGPTFVSMVLHVIQSKFLHCRELACKSQLAVEVALAKNFLFVEYSSSKCRNLH